jgi:hypothetical protein
MKPLLNALTVIFSLVAGLLHWDLWANHGYDGTPVRELIIAAAVVGTLAGLLAFSERPGATMPAVVANAAFLLAFALSRVAQLPTLHGGWSESGLAPDGVTSVGISTTLVVLVAEALAVTFGLVSFLLSRDPKAVPLPTAFART